MMTNMILCGIGAALTLIAFGIIRIGHHLRNIDWWLMDIKGKLK